MRDYKREDSGLGFSTDSLLRLVRAGAAFLGVAAIAIGIVYAMRIFNLIYTTLSGPETFQTHIEKWAPAVGGKELDFIISGNTYHGANIVALVAIGGATAILAWISMGLMVTGAKVVSWTLGDREAIKKMLVHAFGPGGRPGESPTAGAGNVDRRTDESKLT